MNKRLVLGGVAAVIVVVVIVVVYQIVHLRSEAAKWAGPVKEISEEQITHDESVTHIRFVSLIDAPLPAVQRVLWDVEHSDQTVANIKLSKLLKSEGNTKLLEMRLQALSLPLLQYTMEFTLDPTAHRISFKTVQSPAQEIEGAYQLEASPDGHKTQIVYTSTVTEKVNVPFPQSVLDSANRETYVNTVRGIEKSVQGGAAPAAS